MFKIGECEQEWSFEFIDFAYFCSSLDSFAYRAKRLLTRLPLRPCG